MKVKDLIKLLQECNPEKEISVDNDNIINGIQELFFDDEVVIFTAPKEENIADMDRDEFFLSLADNGDMLDSKFINRAFN